MNLYHNLSEPEARHAASLAPGDEMVIVVPLPKQPPEGWKPLYIPYDDPCSIYGDQDGEATLYELPIPSGKVGLREPWWMPQKGNLKYRYSRIIYKYSEERPYCLNGGNDSIYFNCPDGETEKVIWRSSSCMPIKAIRHWYMVTGSRVDRVQGVTEWECKLAGFDSFAVLVLPNGNIMCDPPSVLPSEDFQEEKGEIVRTDNHLIVNKTEWKGEPLTIIVNGFVWFNAHHSKPRPVCQICTLRKGE